MANPQARPGRRNERAEAILIRRCRSGDAEALRILAIRLAPLLCPAAHTAPSPQARERCLAAWRAVLRALAAWHAPSLAKLERLAARAGGRRKSPSPDTTADLPQDLMAELLAEAEKAAEHLSQAAQRRWFWTLQGYAVILALILGGAMMFATYQSMDRFATVPANRLSALQFRIRHAALSTRLRDIAWDLLSGTGDAGPAARILVSATLALDEIASTPPLRSSRLRYVVWRIAATDLPDALQDLAATLPPGKREPVLDAALALEEVEVWFAKA